MMMRRAVGAGVVAVCCAVIALAVTGGGGMSPSVLVLDQRGKQLSVVQLLAGEAVEPLHGQHLQFTTAMKKGAV